MAEREQSTKSLAIRGTMWTLFGFGWSRMFRLLSHLILAWLLTPQIFGLMALVKVFRQGLQMFSDVGIGPSIIQNKRGDQQAFLDTAWTIQVIRGFGLWIVTCILAYPVAWWYAQNDDAAWSLWYLLPIAALSAVFAGFNSTALFTLNKKLRLGRLTLLELATQFVSLAVMVGWALIHPTIWAMIVGGLASTLFKMLLSHFMVPGQRVRIGWDQNCARELIRFGKWIFLSTIFTFFALNLDKVVLGKLLTLEQLGVYVIALVFAKAALDVTMRMGGAVLFPVYSKYQDQPKRLMSIAMRARETILWPGAAVCIAFAVISPLFFETLWDERYHDAGWIAQWISVYIWARILLHTMGRIPLALGNSRSLFVSNVIQTCGILPAVGGYLMWDLPGFIVGLATGPVAAHVYLLRFLPMRAGEMLWQTVRFTAAAITVGSSAVLGTLWIREVGDELTWILMVIACAVIPVLVASGVVLWRIRDDSSGRIQPAAVPEGAVH